VYGTSPDGADAMISLAVYPGIYYDQRPSMGGTATPVDGHTDAYALNKEVVMKWGDRSISVVDLTFSDAPVQATTEQLAQIGELLRS
jgi:hypothetical protein